MLCLSCTRTIGSEKAFVNTVSQNVDVYSSSSDEKDRNFVRNLCLMAKETVEFDEGYLSSGSKYGDEDVKPD